MTEYAGDKNKWLVTVQLNPSLNQADVLRLLDYQLERVAGWKKVDKSGAWAFEVDGIKWVGGVKYAKNGQDGFSISLHVIGK